MGEGIVEEVSGVPAVVRSILHQDLDGTVWRERSPCGEETWTWRRRSFVELQLDPA